MTGSTSNSDNEDTASNGAASVEQNTSQHLATSNRDERADSVESSNSNSNQATPTVNNRNSAQVTEASKSDADKRSSPDVPEYNEEPPHKKSKHSEEKAVEPFDPVKHGLSPTFCLTNFVETRARKCKVSTTAIDSTLRAAQNKTTDPSKEGSEGLSMDVSIIGSGSRFPGLAMLQTQEIVYPVVDDPYILGRIACTALLSNMCAVGVYEVDNILMKLGVSQYLEEKQRDIVVPMIVKGFRDTARKAGTRVTGGETVINPWCMIGGVATSVCSPEEYISPDNCSVGDVLVLTKPLGTLIAINCHQWLKNPILYQKIRMMVSEKEVIKAYQRAVSVMSRLNITAAKLMHKYRAHAATNIGGFGLLGSAMGLARCQKNEVSFVIHNLPVISKMASVAKSRSQMFPLTQGLVSELSGGLLICLPREQAAAFCKEIEAAEGSQAWIIGIVEKGDRLARIIDKPRVIEVPFKDKEGELW